MSKDKSDHKSKDEIDNDKNDTPTELLSHPSYQDLQKQLEEAEQKANQYWERVLRMEADNKNILRRTERDVANAYKYSLEKFVTELLPIIDSLELCIANAPANNKETVAIIDGVALTLKMFYNTLEKFGVKQINPVAQAFDPEHHQAISVQNDPSIKPGTVISVLQKGYLLNDRLVRPALVVVSKAD